MSLSARYTKWTFDEEVVSFCRSHLCLYWADYDMFGVNSKQQQMNGRKDRCGGKAVDLYWADVVRIPTGLSTIFTQFLCLSLVTPGKCRDSTSIISLPFPSKSFPFCHSSIIIHSTLCCQIYQQPREIKYTQKGNKRRINKNAGKNETCLLSVT
jgi:hypothetical protein